MPLDLPNVDTDRIIPARFLRQPRASGYGKFLFHDLRFGADGASGPIRPQPSRVPRGADPGGRGELRLRLLAREGGLGALDHGIRVVIAPSFGDIFFENCFKNGVLAIVLPAETGAGLRSALTARPGITLTVDLEAQTIAGADGPPIRFEVDAFRKHGLLTGRDELDLTLEQLPAIEAFEARRRVEMPWLG